MTKKQLIYICLMLIPFNLLSQNLTDKVDMLMGTHNDSYCVAGPQLPHGSINPSPQTPNGHHGGYAPDQPIRGFGQLHVSGTGWGRYGQIFISPQIGFDATETGHDSPKSEEVAKPYYYAVYLDRYNILTEITPTHSCAVYRITYPEAGDKNILLDIMHNIPQHIATEIKGKFLGGEIFYDDKSNKITGWGEYKGGFGSWDPYKVYFVIQPDVKPQKVDISNKGEEALYAQIRLPENTSVIHLNVGISLRSIENAEKFLVSEIGNKTFDEIKNTAKDIWETTLSKIKIKGGTDDEQRIFYTGLYHSHLMARDRTGDNPHQAGDTPHLDDHYCVWDTWRTKYPLMILLDENYVAKTINSFIDRFARDGMCTPSYTSSLEFTMLQGGDDVDNVIADAIIKEVKGFDYNKAYEIMKWNAFNARSKEYQKLGWNAEVGGEMSCSYGLEYAYNDFCTASVAQIMNDRTNADLLKDRSESWQKLFNPNLESGGFKGFIGPRKEDGEWINIDPAKIYASWVEYFYEGNSWTYSLFVPHQIDKLIELCGGKEEMVKRLSYGFDNDLIEISNEPGFLSPFIFSHCERPDLAAKYVSIIRDTEFSLTEGYPGNEDSGAMGSWYVFTSIGLFPNAGQDFYYLLPPAFDETEITLSNGKKLTIRTIKTNFTDNQIGSITVNGKRFDTPWIKHNEIINGGEIIIKLTNNTSY
ncbi:MAG: GH92 family glycosyl hydrolase [Dysgonomonas sp.]|nr:GH92 family glycosyl hydrolase [Dysgonomonas sp.]